MPNIDANKAGVLWNKSILTNNDKREYTGWWMLCNYEAHVVYKYMWINSINSKTNTTQASLCLLSL